MAVVELSEEQVSSFKVQGGRRTRSLSRLQKAHATLQWTVIAAAFVFVAALVFGIVP